MQPLYDLIPVLLFFLVFKWLGIYAATTVLIITTVLQLVWQWFTRRKISSMLLTTAALVLVFGGLTLYVHDERFILWKPSVLYVLFAAAFSLSTVFGEQPLLQRTLGSQLQAPRVIWQWASLHWAGFFLLLAVVNAVFVVHFSRDAWANWKLASVGVVLVFAVLQMFWLNRHASPIDPPATPGNTP